MTGFAPVIGSYDVHVLFAGVVSTIEDWTPKTIRLGGQAYAIDVTKTKHASQATLRDTAALATEPSDALFNTEGAWSRYRYSWHYGADQEFADFIEGDANDQASPLRFNTSSGIDPWTRGQLTLLPSTASALTLSNAGNQICVSNGRVYVSDGTALKYSTDLTNWTTATAPGGTVLSLATDGVDLYCATSTVLKKYANGAPGTPVDFSTPVSGNCELVAFVANRLLLAKDNVLSEVAASGALTTVYTHFQSAFQWTTCFAIGSRIYVGGFAGQRSELHSLAVSSTGSLVYSVEAAPLPAGELLRTGRSNAGLVVLGTSKGVRMAQVGADGTLTYGPQLAAVGDVYDICFEGRFAWCGWTGHPSGGRGTARMALDTTVDVLQPAYASDVYTTTAGTVTGVARFGNRTLFILDGSALMAASNTDYLTEGWIDSGRLYFGTVENKALTELNVTFDALAASESVFGSVYDETDTHLATGVQTEDGAADLNVNLDSTQVRYCTVRVTLRGPGTTTPTVRHWRLRGYPVPPTVYQWLVALLLYERTVINLGMGEEVYLDPYEEIERIRAWFETKERINYQEGDRAYRVRVDAFEFQPEGWTDEGDFFRGTCMVRLVSA